MICVGPVRMKRYRWDANAELAPHHSLSETMSHPPNQPLGNYSSTPTSGENDLPEFQDPGEVPKHRRPDYKPMVDAKPVPGAPRKGTNAISPTKAKEDNTAMVGIQYTFPASVTRLFKLRVFDCVLKWRLGANFPLCKNGAWRRCL